MSLNPFPGRRWIVPEDRRQEPESDGWENSYYVCDEAIEDEEDDEESGDLEPPRPSKPRKAPKAKPKAKRKPKPQAKNKTEHRRVRKPKSFGNVERTHPLVKLISIWLLAVWIPVIFGIALWVDRASVSKKPAMKTFQGLINKVDNEH